MISVGMISIQLQIRMKKNSAVAIATMVAFAWPRLSSTCTFTLSSTVSHISCSLVGTWSSVSLVSCLRAQNPSRVTSVPATSRAQIVSMLKVMPRKVRWTCSPIGMSALITGAITGPSAPSAGAWWS